VELDGRVGSEWIFRRLAREGVEWIQLAQGRGRWRTLLNTVMNLRVLTPRSYLVTGYRLALLDIILLNIHTYLYIWTNLIACFEKVYIQIFKLVTFHNINSNFSHLAVFGLSTFTQCKQCTEKTVRLFDDLLCTSTYLQLSKTGFRC
jgi:hypothetical protein